MYERPARPPRRHHDDPDPDTAQFRVDLIDAIDHDPQVRAAILRLLAAQRRPRPEGRRAAARRGDP